MKRFQTLSLLATLAVVIGMISWGTALNAQTTTPNRQAQQPSQTPDTTPPQQTPQTQPTPSPEMPPSSQQTPNAQSPESQTPPSQTPDTTAPESGAKAGANRSAAGAGENGAQTFTGTVVKQGDKYVLKDDTGKTYDIDHQTDVAKFEGKRVRVQGTLDDTGKKILVK